MNTYTSFEFYSDQYKGSVLNSSLFDKYALKASYAINAYTYGKIQTVTDDIEMATCEVAEILYKSELAGGEIVSESVGSWSKTFRADKSMKKDIMNVLFIYLGNSGLLYAGVPYV